MSLWRRITASASLEGEQYVVVYAGNTATTDDDLNLIAYPFDSATGFGDRLVPLEFIQDGFQGGGRVAFSPSGGAIATTAGPVGGLFSYGWDEGFGSRVLSSAKPAGADNVAFHPDGDVVFVSHAENSSTSRLYAYNWSDVTGFGSTRATSGTVSNGAQDFMPIAVSPNAQFVAVGYGESVNLAIFPFSKSTGFGSKVEPSVDPISNLEGSVFDVAWNNAGTYVALACGSADPTKRLHIWEWDNSTGTLGSKVASTTIEPTLTASTGTIYSVAFDPNDDAIIIGFAGGVTDAIQAYAWDNATGTFGARYASPSVAPGGVPRDLRFNTSGNVLFASGGDASAAPVVAYQWDGATGFGTKYDNPDNSGLGAQYNAYSIDYKDFG